MAFIETKNDLLADLNLNGNYEYPSLEVMSEGETRFMKDLRINLKNE